MTVKEFVDLVNSRLDEKITTSQVYPLFKKYELDYPVSNEDGKKDFTLAHLEAFCKAHGVDDSALAVLEHKTATVIAGTTDISVDRTGFHEIVEDEVVPARPMPKIIVVAVDDTVEHVRTFESEAITSKPRVRRSCAGIKMR